MKPAKPRSLTINGGSSSSIKFALFEAGDSFQRILDVAIERIGLPEAALRAKGLHQADNFSRLVTAPDHTAAVVPRRVTRARGMVVVALSDCQAGTAFNCSPTPGQKRLINCVLRRDLSHQDPLEYGVRNPLVGFSESFAGRDSPNLNRIKGVQNDNSTQ